MQPAALTAEVWSGYLEFRTKPWGPIDSKESAFDPLESRVAQSGGWFLPKAFRFIDNYAAVMAILLLAAAWFGLAPAPALADHQVIQEEVDTLSGCRTLDPVLDVGQGFPVILLPYALDEEGSVLQAKLYIRPLSSNSAEPSRGAQQDWGKALDWLDFQLELGIAAGINALHAYAVRTLNEAGSGTRVEANLAYDNGGQTYLTTYSQGLSETGLPQGSSTAETRPIAWGSGFQPSMMGPGPYGLPMAGWGPDGLGVLTGIDSPPAILITRDDVNWPFAGDPPTDMGTNGQDGSSYLVTIGEGYWHAFLNQDPATWNRVDDPLPSDLTLDESMDLLAGDGGPPTATVVTDDGILEWEYLKETTVGPVNTLCDDFKVVVTVWELSELVFYHYVLYQCPETGAINIRIKRIGNSAYYADLVGVQGYFGGQNLLAARADPQGNLILITSTEGTGADGKPTEKTIYTTVKIDYNSLEWTEGQ